ncbi:MbeD/MobD family mobilization/exclusion protein [Pseudoalteromonas sp. SR41-4]|uniref:MbeD/MobD family mobilization/exclusion protein n=1 Tax=Pseudoalteromonas sp. SR41-4 TaxID=2760950 RepID=UPI001C71B326
MTELESQLLKSVTEFQQQQELQSKELSKAYAALQQMFETTSAENHQLREQVQNLVLQVKSLAQLLNKQKR